MNLFNRVVVVLLLLALSVTMIVVAVLPVQVVDFIKAVFDPMVITPLDRIVLILATAIVTIVSVALIYAEIRPEKPKGVKLRDINGGVAELSTESIAARIKQMAESMPDIRQVTPTVVSRGNSVDIKVGLVANPGVDVSQKASEVVQTIRNLVEKDIGIKVGKLRVNIKYDTRVAQQPQKA